VSSEVKQLASNPRPRYDGQVREADKIRKQLSRKMEEGYALMKKGEKSEAGNKFWAAYILAIRYGSLSNKEALHLEETAYNLWVNTL